MRKAMIATLLLLVLAIGGVCAAAAGVYEAHDQVTLTETVVYGDRAAADGLTVTLRTKYEDHLFWDTTCTMGAQTRTETEYSFSASPISERRPRTYSGISLNSRPTFGLDQDATSGLELAYLELYNSTEPGEEKSAVVYLTDYIDYYPITVSLDFPGTSQEINGSAVPDWVPEEGTTYYALLKLRDYFRIPVLEEECYEISVQKPQAINASGNVVAVNSSSRGVDFTRSDHFYMETFSSMTDDACYFTFDAHSLEGKLVDVSELPEGYGIYRLPYEENRHDESGQMVCSVDADALEMVYPLDPEIELLALEANEAQTKLLLHAIENGSYVLTVIDLETMSILQKLEIIEWPEEESGWQLYDGDDFMAVRLFDSRLAVISTADSGEYELQFLCDVFPEELEDSVFAPAVLDFDGERLVSVDLLRDGRFNDCNFAVAVHDRSGLAYYGEYRSSLSTGAWYDFSYCSSRSNDPLSVCWTEGT